jgi:hypothetical protein
MPLILKNGRRDTVGLAIPEADPLAVFIASEAAREVLRLTNEDLEAEVDHQMIDLRYFTLVFDPQIMDDGEIVSGSILVVDVMGSFKLAFYPSPNLLQLDLDSLALLSCKVLAREDLLKGFDVLRTAGGGLDDHDWSPAYVLAGYG